MNLIIPFLMGIVLYIIIFIYYPWPKEKDKFFWIAVFTPIILLSFVNLEDNLDALRNMINALLTGMIASEIIKPRLIKIKNKFKEKLDGDPLIKEEENRNKTKRDERRKEKKKSNKTIQK